METSLSSGRIAMMLRREEFQYSACGNFEAGPGKPYG
jgi:hypothetical protein